ncbi:MAG TPA: hypothetical protein VGV38_17055 [Pyrinomonadaceae bacterium]|nr:hypothetical protein [Pyrinomonadaceae bacterium]
MKLRVCGVLTITALLMAAQTAFGQGRERVIIWQWQDAAAPFPGPVLTGVDGKTAPSDVTALEVLDILVAGKPVRICQPFAAGGDWMKDFEVRVKNVSGKPIAYARLHLTLPEAENGGVLLGVGLRHGGAAGGGWGQEAPKVIMPGDEFVLKRTEEEYERDRQWVAESGGVTDISRVWFGRINARFADDTVWAGFPRIRGVPVNSACP